MGFLPAGPCFRTVSAVNAQTQTVTPNLQKGNLISGWQLLRFYDTILNIEAEEYDIAVLHHVVLALHAYQPFLSGCIVGTAV